MEVGDGLHLTYCTNIHPAVGWEAVQDSLRAHAPALKARLSPDAPFGIGLRLSGAESTELLEGDRLAEFRAWLDAEGLYVFTINGFPHGTFHGQPVKADVHAPDWRSEERVAYTLRLAEILSALLPDGVDGTISTSPLSYARVDRRRRASRACTRERAARRRRAARHADRPRDRARGRRRARRRRRPGPVVAGAARPRARDACASTPATRRSPTRTPRRRSQRSTPRRSASARRSSAPRCASRSWPAPELERFADPIYLHQVTQRNKDGSLQSWPDLPEALDGYGGGEEWRVHFHVPIFEERYGALRSTQDHLRDVIERVRDRTSHLEIETYTWDVLPADLKASSVDSIAREYEWVLDVLG